MMGANSRQATARNRGWRGSFALAGWLLLTWMALFGAIAARAQPAAAAPPTVTADEAAIARSVQRLHDDGSYQFSIPPRQEPPQINLPEWLKRFLAWLGGAGNWLVQGLMWLLIAAAVLFALYLLVPAFREVVDRVIRSRRKVKTAEEADEGWYPDAAVARNLLAEADALAAEGHFGAAVHLLLGRSIEDITNRRPGLLKPALTARAIALMEQLPAAARDAFGRLAAIVERSLWARRDIGVQDWEIARRDYEDFAFGTHWRGTDLALAPVAAGAAA